jgi:uncharacterized protein (TIGR02145 family)
MKLDRNSIRPIASFALALVALVACQNATEPKSVSNDPLVATGSFNMANLSRIPDSADWRSHSDSGIKAPACDTTACVETFHLAHPLNSDSVALELWTLGIRTSTLFFGEVGRSTVLDLKLASTQRDTLDTLLLSRFHGLAKASSDSFLALGKGASSLVAYYAHLILTGDPDFKGKPQPVGMSQDSIRKALVYWSAKAGQTYLQLAAMNLGLDTAKIHALAIALVQSGTLKPQDTLSLLHPVRLTKALSVSENLTAGGSPVSATGTFAWSRGKTVSATITLRSATGTAANVAYTLRKQPASGDTTWSLDSNLTLQAASTADTGTDTLVVTLSCDCGSSAVARTPMRVVHFTVAGDTTAPTIQRVNPIHDTTLAWSAKTANLSWTVFDNFQLAQVRLNDSLLTSTTALYQKTVPLAVGQNTFVLLASDTRGNPKRDTLRITRLADTSHPLLHRIAHTTDTILLSSQSTDSVSWTVTDNALQSVAINGTSVTGIGDTYSRAVPVSDDSTWIALVATDSSGNTVRDSLLVRRLFPPTITPRGGVFQANQTTTASLSSRSPSAILSYSTDKSNWSAYSTSLSISKSQILYARVTWVGVVSDVDSAVFLYSPTISPVSGGFTGTQTVSIAAPGSPAIEDSLSTGTGWTTYTGTISVNANVKVFARSRLGGVVSDLAESDYAFAPVLSPTAASDTGVDSATVKVMIAGEVDSVEWTQDTTAAGKWTRLTSTTVVLKSSGTFFVRTRAGTATSPIAAATVQLVLAAPGISLPAGTYAMAQAVTLTSSANGADIHYTTDGTAPTAQSPLYSKAVPVGASQTLRAIATKSGFRNSAVSSEAYAIADTNTYGIPWNRDIAYGTITDSRDSQIYRTVKIGTQTWMAQNLNFAAPSISYCYGDSSTNCPMLGRYYSSAMAGGSSLCPTGWHVPNDTDWNTLISFVNSSMPGINLKSKSGWDSTGSGLDSYGFRALPAGHHESLGVSSSYERGTDGKWWSSSYDLGNGHEYFWGMSYQSNSMSHNTTRAFQCSIRCLQDP